MKKILMIIMILVLLVGCNTSKKEMTDAMRFKEEYENLNGEKTSYDDSYYRTIDIAEDNPIIYKDASDIVKMIDNKDTFVVYFGFSSCPWCRSVVPNLISVANVLGIDTIYYVDVKDIRDTMELDSDGNIITSKEGIDSYYELLNRLDSVLDDYTLTDKDGNVVDTNEKRIYAPNIVAVVDGVATKMTTGISDLQENAYDDLTDEINNESYDKIKCTIECIKEEKKICSIDKKC